MTSFLQLHYCELSVFASRQFIIVAFEVDCSSLLMTIKLQTIIIKA
jgi:hypothetical protein